MLLRSCAIWRENEREVTVMKQYILDTRMGTIQEEPIQGKMGWDRKPAREYVSDTGSNTKGI